MLILEGQVPVCYPFPLSPWFIIDRKLKCFPSQHWIIKHGNERSLHKTLAQILSFGVKACVKQQFPVLGALLGFLVMSWALAHLCDTQRVRRTWPSHLVPNPCPLAQSTVSDFLCQRVSHIRSKQWEVFTPPYPSLSLQQIHWRAWRLMLAYNSRHQPHWILLKSKRAELSKSIVCLCVSCLFELTQCRKQLWRNRGWNVTTACPD